MIQMIQGNIEIIKSCLFSESKYVRMDALRWAAYHHLSDSDIIERIRELKKDDSILSGYTVSNFATAALEKMGIEKYTGSDTDQKAITEFFVPSKEQADNLLKKINQTS